MGKWDGLNRRKFPRVKYPCLVVVKNEKKGTEEALLTHTENIGLGGVCVILNINLEMFVSVNLEIDLLDLGDHIRCEGKVVWNVQRKADEEKKPSFYDVGIEFVDLDNKDLDRLTEIVKRIVDNQKVFPY